MKKLTKILLTSSLSLLLTVVSVVTYLHAQSNDDKLSNLTLANIEALGYDTVQEAAIGGCAGCIGSNESCFTQIYDMSTGNLILTVECPGYFPG